MGWLFRWRQDNSGSRRTRWGYDTGVSRPKVQLARSFPFWGSLFLVASGFGACGPGLPSTVPLGGSETAEQASPAPPTNDREPADEPAGDSEGAAGAGNDADSEAESEADSAPSAKACQDDAGVAPECGELETGACGALFGPICGRLARSLKPKVAGAIVDCLREKNRSSECAALEACAEAGLEHACSTEAEATPCRETLERCAASGGASPWATQERCERALGAFTKASRTKVLECLQKSCELGRCFTEPLLKGSP